MIQTLAPKRLLFLLAFLGMTTLIMAQCVVTTISTPEAPGEIIFADDDFDYSSVEIVPSSVPANTSYGYLVTDQNYIVLEVILDSSPLDLSAYSDEDVIIVWGFNYTGTVLIMPGMSAFGMLSDGCFHISQNCIMIINDDGGGGGGDPCDGLVDGGTIATEDGETTVNITTVGDGVPDIVSVDSSGVNASASFTYIVTDGMGTILGIPPGDDVDVEGAGPGNCRIYGLSYTGNLTATVGQNLFTDLSDDCFDLSDNFVLTIRTNDGGGGGCTAEAGTLTADNATVTLSDADDVVSATPNGDQVVPAGYELLYVLTRDVNGEQRIFATSTTPSFVVTAPGDYRVHALVAETSDASNPDFLDLSVIQLGVTTATQVVNIIANNGLCADLDAEGAPTTVLPDPNCLADAGTSTPGESTVELGPEGTATISATGDGNQVVPAGYEQFFVLTTDPFFTILDINDTGVFTVDAAGTYTISIVVAETTDASSPDFIDLSVIEFGVTNGSDIIGIFETSGVCASIDLAGSVVTVTGEGGGGDDCDDQVEGGTVMIEGGGTTVTFNSVGDGIPDVVTLDSMGTNAMANFTYVVTDASGMILGVPPGDMVDVDGAGPGDCRVYGLSYTGNLTIMPMSGMMITGDLSDDCFDVSDNWVTTIRTTDGGGGGGLDATLFASSNTSGLVGIYGIDGTDIGAATVPAASTDSDGLYFDCDNSVLYQVDRTNNMVVAYSIMNGTNTVVGMSAGGNFSNGRGLTYSDGRIVVADDVDGANAFYVYSASDDGTSITLTNTYTVDINLWGLQAVGETLYAVSDNTNMVAVYNDFFDNDDGDVDADAMITVESLVRTHGIFYDVDNDIMFLTDVGSGMVDDDGAFVVVNNFTAAAADGTLSDDEQIRVEGAGTFLGNPVDIAYDPASMSIYIAERANGGGRILAFDMPTMDGAMAPYYDDDSFDGASAVWFADCDNGDNGGGSDDCEDQVEGGTVMIEGGGTTVTFNSVGDGIPDVVTLDSMGINAMANFTYVVTDASGMILGVPPGDMVDVDGAGPGDCRVYGLSYTGNLTIMPMSGMMITDDLSDDCFDVSDNWVTTIRTTDGGGGGGTCDADAGTVTATETDVDLDDTGMATISATADGNQVVPTDYEVTYVLTLEDGADLIIVDAATAPSFNVMMAGTYRIHVLVAETSDNTDANFFGLSQITFGTTTAAEVLMLISMNNICASLDPMGAAITVSDDGGFVCTADAGTLTAVESTVELEDGTAMISATLDGNQVIPMNYEIAYALTTGPDQMLVNLSITTPDFTVTAEGDYTIVTVIAEANDPTDPNFIDPFSLLQPGTTVQTFQDILATGICGAVDSIGATITVTDDTPGLQSTGVETVAELQVTAYPNPAVDQLTVDVSDWIASGSQSERITLRLLDATGQIVEVRRAVIGYGQTTLNFDLQGVERGSYFLQIMQRERTETIRVTKM